MIPKTPLEEWIHQTIAGSGNSGELTRLGIESYQLEKIQQTVAHARENSPFYRQHLAGLGTCSIQRLDDLTRLPFTTATDISTQPMPFLCVSRDDISRCVTLPTSGTTGPPKRVFLTRDDLARTLDFFHHGMSTLVGPGDRVMILLSGDRPDSVGDLLQQALARMNVHGLVMIPPFDPQSVWNSIPEQGITCLVGAPVPILSLARNFRNGNHRYGRIHSVLLTTDHVSESVVRAVETGLGCRVFQHYGMTEMGWGGGVDCIARQGYHLREADIFVEIVEPETGHPLPDGATGEIVFTTLTRSGMPLIRYRTGDLARFHTTPCPCRTVLKRLDYIARRRDGIVHLKSGGSLTLPMLDEVLFDRHDIIDFQAEVTGDPEMPCLHIALHVLRESDWHAVFQAAEEHLMTIPAIRNGHIRLHIEPASNHPGMSFMPGNQKRVLRDHRFDGSHYPSHIEQT